MEGSNSSCRHEIIQMNTEMLNNISEKLQQATRQTAQEKRRKKEEAEAKVAAIKATLQQRISRED
jgi:F0F1-type ATP synthase membrane subunit b/b'